MAVNEEIVTGKKFRRLIDIATNKWRRYSFWNKAKDTECEDGTDVETKVGAIKGITTSTNVSETGYAADAKTVSEINQSLTYTTSQDVVIGSLNGKELHRHVYNIIKSDNLQTMTIDTGIKSGDIDCMINIYGTYKASNGVYYVLSPQSSLRCEVVLSSKGVELIIKGINAVKVTAVIEYTLA